MSVRFSMSKTSATACAALIFAVLLASGCGRDLNSAQGVAEEFVDQHYVAIDLPKAKALAVSVALHKIDEEIRLTSGQKIDASTQNPRGHYRLMKKTQANPLSPFLYKGTTQTPTNTPSTP